MTSCPDNTCSDDRRWPHRWGFADTQFIVNPDRSVTLTGNRYELCDRTLPNFLPYLEDGFGVSIDWDHPLPDNLQVRLPPPRRDPAFCSALAEQFPPEIYSFEDCDRLRHSHGQSMIEEVWKVLYQTLDRFVDLVFYCHTEEQACTLIRLASEHDVCLVPYGGGTSVSGALVMPTAEQRMIVAVDTRAMNKVEWVDTNNQRACVQAGITGSALEAALNPHGYTCGHEPDSRELSTLGGWIATNASGMKKNRYGNIEDIVESITLITPTGTISQTHPYPRTATGMPLQKLLFGSEGNLGLIIKAIIRIRPLPNVKSYNALLFPTIDHGISYLHHITQANCIPASIRLVDNPQFRFSQVLKPQPTGLTAWISKLQKQYLFKLRRLDPHQITAATLVLEGTAEEVAYQKRTLFKLAKQHQGIVGGSSNGRSGYMLTYAIAYIGQFLMKYHILGETFETTAAWSDITPIVKAVKAELTQQFNKIARQHNLPGCPYLSYRVTQIYPTGVCIYFTLGLYLKGIPHPAKTFNQLYAALRQTILTHGGSLSHHHGIGKMRQPFLPQTLSPQSLTLLKQIKAAADPDNIFGIRNTLYDENNPVDGARH